MLDDVDRVLLDRARIARRVEELARQISRDLSPHASTASPSVASASEAVSPSGGGGGGGAGAGAGGAPAGEITLVPILTGSIIFVADLIRHLPLRLRIRLVSIRSYPGTATSSRGAQLQQELTHLPVSLAGAHVLVIDDILDSGSTLRRACDLLRALGPATLRTCVLLRKDRPQARAFPVDYVCFDIPDRFVVGYGLDYNDYYRNVPDIVTLKPEVLAR